MAGVTRSRAGWLRQWFHLVAAFLWYMSVELGCVVWCGACIMLRGGRPQTVCLDNTVSPSRIFGDVVDLAAGWPMSWFLDVVCTSFGVLCSCANSGQRCRRKPFGILAAAKIYTQRRTPQSRLRAHVHTHAMCCLVFYWRGALQHFCTTKTGL